MKIGTAVDFFGSVCFFLAFCLGCFLEKPPAELIAVFACAVALLANGRVGRLEDK